jgi:hypothetical protein
MPLNYKKMSSVQVFTVGETKFPECHMLPRVPKIGHPGKPVFPKCCTRGREASPSAYKCMTLGEARHSRKAIFPKCNTRGREALEKEKLHMTARMDGEWTEP